MKYNGEYGHIEIEADELCFALFGRKNLGDGQKSKFSSAMKLKSSLASRLASTVGGEYYMNVSVSNTSKYDGIYYYTTGVCDGVQKRGGEYSVFETVVTDKRGVPLLRNEFFEARLKILSFFICRQKNVGSIEACRAVFNGDTGELKIYRENYSAEELRGFYIGIIAKIHLRGKFVFESANTRKPSLSGAVFPYRELRENQADMIRECYADIKHGSRLFCQAPTGIGKTISTLYASVKSMGAGVTDKIFYLTSKASIRKEALAASSKLGQCGSKIYTCVISSKEQVCLCDDARRGTGRVSSYCSGERCPYARGYYERVDGAIFELISGGFEFDRDDIIRMAKKHRICPHELSLDLSELCDVIICDYNYVFSPTVYLKRYFDDKRGEKYVFLVDEAHNLPDRARDLFSAKLSLSQFLIAREVIGEKSKLYSVLDEVISELENLSILCEDNLKYDSNGRRSGYYIGHVTPEKLSEKLEICIRACEKWLWYNEESPAYAVIDGLRSQINEYRVAQEHFGRNYLTFISVDGDEAEILLYCLDPSPILDFSLGRASASVMFSATLTPTEYFADILGGGKKGVSVSFGSPFPSENLCVASVNSISTRYEDREKSYGKIASCIAATISARNGNYMVFLPSYDYAERVAEKFTKKYPMVKTAIQKRGMTYRDREDFLNFFCDDGKLRVGFCVIGGSFSEGIDLPGDRLIGAVVVGVGLPSISNERNIMRDYFDEKCGCGFDYAYTYPGMNSVLQAVGRVIRRESDRGIAVLIDDRYSEPKYRELFPEQWDVKYAGNAVSLAEMARNFWKNQNNSI